MALNLRALLLSARLLDLDGHGDRPADIALMAATLFTLRWIRARRTSYLVTASLLAGFAFLTRNDSLLLSGVIFAFLLLEAYINKWDKPAWLKMIYAAALYLIFPLAQTVFRLLYYGQLLPNTYTLKLANFPLSIRLLGGAGFVAPILTANSLGPAARRFGAILQFPACTVFSIHVRRDGARLPGLRRRRPMAQLAHARACHAGPLHPRDHGHRRSGCARKWLASRAYLSASILFLLPLISLFVADLPFLDDMSVRAPPRLPSPIRSTRTRPLRSIR